MKDYIQTTPSEITIRILETLDYRTLVICMLVNIFDTTLPVPSALMHPCFGRYATNSNISSLRR